MLQNVDCKAHLTHVSTELSRPITNAARDDDDDDDNGMIVVMFERC